MVSTHSRLLPWGRARLANTDTLCYELKWALFEAVQHLDDLLLRRTRLGFIVATRRARAGAGFGGFVQEILGWNA